MWFDSWPDILRTLLVGSASYLTLVVVLRLSGKRTLSQLNAFDFIVTVAIGSTLATILLNASVSWAEGAAALALLAGLQLVAAWISSRRPGARIVLTAKPALLLQDGCMQAEALEQNRLTESEVLQAIRGNGSGEVADVAAVVLETNGKLSVIERNKFGNGSALKDVSGAEPQSAP